MDGWLETSHMARRGVAKGKAGELHRLTEAGQGKYHYVYGPYVEPVLRIRPGDRVEAETATRSRGAIRTEHDMPTAVLNMPFVNPQNGPIAVEGAEKGDVLAVHIQSIRPRGPQPVGTTALIPEFGGLVATPNTALLNQPAARAGQEDGGDRGRGPVQRQDHPALRAVHRHARRLARDRGDQLAARRTIMAATWTCRTWRRGRSSTSRSSTRTPTSISATATAPRATASCAASRSRWRPRSPSRST